MLAILQHVHVRFSLYMVCMLAMSQHCSCQVSPVHVMHPCQTQLGACQTVHAKKSIPVSAAVAIVCLSVVIKLLLVTDPFGSMFLALDWSHLLRTLHPCAICEAGAAASACALLCTDLQVFNVHIAVFIAVFIAAT